MFAGVAAVCDSSSVALGERSEGARNNVPKSGRPNFKCLA